MVAPLGGEVIDTVGGGLDTVTDTADEEPEVP
jgi:hypothetical protein